MTGHKALAGLEKKIKDIYALSVHRCVGKVYYGGPFLPAKCQMLQNSLKDYQLL
jgi:hypothetical protein